jgi:hypothetical protein
MERRSITVEAGLHRKILSFRAFLLAHGIDTDYTTTINLLADYGFDELLKSEFSVGLLERLGNQVVLDRSTRETISKDWLEGKIPGLRTGVREPLEGESHAQVARTARLSPRAPRKQESVQAFCVRCKALREMRDTRLVTLKNGKKAVQGVCSICGTKMTHFGLPR